MKHMLLLLGMVAALPAAAQTKFVPHDCGPLPNTFEGKAYPIDGDTLAGVGFKPHIRLWGIQAPELRDKDKAETVPGMLARARLADALWGDGQTLRCEISKWDRYCRVVARCIQRTDTAGKEGIDIAVLLLMQGVVYSYWLDDTFPGHPELSAEYFRREEMGRRDRNGLWPYWLAERPTAAPNPR